MGGIAAVLYGVMSYGLFLGTILYAIAFVGGLPVPKTIDSGPADPLVPSLIVNALLLGLFAIQHSVMARPAFKKWWTRFVPHSVERTTYVLLASLILVLLFWQWRPMPEPVWSVTHPAGVMILQGIFWLGWGLVFFSTFLINHFELFGLRQVYARLLGRALPEPVFRTPLLYKRVRHPLYLGFLLAFWADAVDDARPSAVRGRHHRLYPARNLSRGARYGRDVRRPVPSLSRAGVDARAMARSKAFGRWRP